MYGIAVDGLSSFRGGSGLLPHQSGRCHLPPGSAVVAIIGHDDSELLPPGCSTHETSHSDGKAIPVTLVGVYQSIGKDAFDRSGHIRRTPMCGSNKINVDHHEHTSATADTRNTNGI